MIARSDAKPLLLTGCAALSFCNPAMRRGFPAIIVQNQGYQRGSAAGGLYRFTSISPARRRMALASRHACIRSNISMSTPNAFSTRSAISGERAALPLTRLETQKKSTQDINTPKHDIDLAPERLKRLQAMWR